MVFGDQQIELVAALPLVGLDGKIRHWVILCDRKTQHEPYVTGLADSLDADNWYLGNYCQDLAEGLRSLHERARSHPYVYGS